MAILSKQIGWSQEAYLLYEVAKKVQFLIQLRSPGPIPDNSLLLENGGDLLLEDGSSIELE